MQLSEGDVIVETTDEIMYKIEESAPPYPVKARPYGKNSDKVVDIPESAMSGYIVGSPQTIAEEVLQASGFSHEDPRCEAGVIVTKKEVVIAFGEVSTEVGFEIFKDWLLNGGGISPTTAAEVIGILVNKYTGREEIAVGWFKNVEMNDMGKPICTECDNHILDERY